jgi:hypothetical protein
MIFNCPKCGKRIKVGDEKAGKKGKCPGCGEILTIPLMEESVEPVEEPEEKPAQVDDGPSEAEKQARLNAEKIRKEIDPVIESVKRLSELSEKAKAISENLQLIRDDLAKMKEEMEDHLGKVLTVLEPADDHDWEESISEKPAPAEPSKPKAGPFTEEDLQKAAVQMANEKRGEYRCLSCRTVWVGANRLLGANPTDAYKCPNGCNAAIVI